MERDTQKEGEREKEIKENKERNVIIERASLLKAGFRIRHIKPADPDLLDTDPPGNAVTFEKRYFIIDQQIGRYFVCFSDCLFYPPFPSMQLKILALFLLQGSEPITIKDCDLVNRVILILLNVPLV